MYALNSNSNGNSTSSDLEELIPSIFFLEMHQQNNKLSKNVRFHLTAYY